MLEYKFLHLLMPKGCAAAFCVLSDRGKLLQNVKTDKNIQDCFLLHRRGFLLIIGVIK